MYVKIVLSDCSVLKMRNKAYCVIKSGLTMLSMLKNVVFGMSDNMCVYVCICVYMRVCLYVYV